MNPQALPFLISAFFGLVIWGMIALRYIYPNLSNKPLKNACEPILYLHAFRYLGLSFIASGVVSSELNTVWAHGAAYGDLTVAILSLLTLALRKTFFLKTALWIFNIIGIIDLIRASILGPIYDVPTYLNATFFIPVFFVPILFWTHIILFVLLLRKSK